MKRKLMIILMICVMLFTLVGCGSEEEPSAKQKLEEIVGGEIVGDPFIKLTMDDLTKASNNKAAAAALQNGKNYGVNAIIESIEEDHIVVSFCDDDFYSPFYTYEFCGYVYGIPSETLIDLEPNQGIYVIGEIVNLEETSTSAFGITENGIALVFNGSVNTKSILNVELMGPDEYFGYEEEYVWDINNGGDILPIAFYSDMDFEEYKTYIGKTVKIEAEYHDGNYIKARILKVVEEEKE